MKAKVKLLVLRGQSQFVWCNDGENLTKDYRGLQNPGLSCCVNSLLQSFSATPELFELLSSWQPPEEAESGSNVPLQLRKALYAMRDQQHPTPHKDFLKCLHRNNIRYWNQHDADEMFLLILNCIQKHMSDQDLAKRIQNLYKIKVDGQIICCECKHVHTVPTHFLSLPLHVNEDKNTLEDCIRSFFEFRKVDGSNAFYCDSCGEKKPSTEGCMPVSLPPILCIHLKRFRSDHGYTRKLMAEVCFPEVFDVTSIFPQENRAELNGTYSLYAVLVHSGISAVFGHYITYVRSEDKRWHHIDDSYVREASWHEVQKTYGGRLQRQTAYVLLYRKFTPKTEQALETQTEAQVR